MINYFIFFLDLNVHRKNIQVKYHALFCTFINIKYTKINKYTINCNLTQYIYYINVNTYN